MSSNKNKNKFFGLISLFVIATIFLLIALLFITVLFPKNVISPNEVIGKLVFLIPFIIILLSISVYMFILAFTKIFPVSEIDNNFNETNFYTSSLFELPNEDDEYHKDFELYQNYLNNEANYVEEFEPLKLKQKEKILAKIGNKYAQTYIDGDKKDDYMYYIDTKTDYDDTYNTILVDEEPSYFYKEYEIDNNIENNNTEENHIEKITEEKKQDYKEDNKQEKIKEKSIKKKKTIKRKGDWISLYNSQENVEESYSKDKLYDSVSIYNNDESNEKYNVLYKCPENYENQDGILLEEFETQNDIINQTVVYEYDDSVLLNYEKSDIENVNISKVAEIIKTAETVKTVKTKDKITEDNIKYNGFNFDKLETLKTDNKFSENKYLYNEKKVEEFPEDIVFDIDDTYYEKLVNIFDVTIDKTVDEKKLDSDEERIDSSTKIIYQNNVSAAVPFVYYKGVDIKRTEEDYIYPTKEQIDLGEFCYKFKPVNKNYNDKLISKNKTENQIVSEKEIENQTAKETKSKYIGFNFDKLKTPIIKTKLSKDKHSYKEKSVEEFPNNIFTSAKEEAKEKDDIKDISEIVAKDTEVFNDYILNNKEFDTDISQYTLDSIVVNEENIKIPNNNNTSIKNIESVVLNSEDYNPYYDDIKLVEEFINPLTNNKKEVEEFAQIPEATESYEYSPVPFVYYKGVDVKRTEEEYIAPSKEQIEKGEFVYAFKPVTKDYSEPVYTGFNFDKLSTPIITNKFVEKKEEYPLKEVEEFAQIPEATESYEYSPVPFVYYKGVDIKRTEEEYIAPTKEILEKGEFCYKFKPITRDYSEPLYTGFNFDKLSTPIITYKFVEKKDDYPLKEVEEFAQIPEDIESYEYSPVPFVYYKGVDIKRSEEEYIAPTKEILEKGEFVYAFKPITKDYSEPLYTGFNFDKLSTPIITNKFVEKKEEYPLKEVEEFAQIPKAIESYEYSPVPFVYYKGVDIPFTEEEYIAPTKEILEKGEFCYKFKPITRDCSEPVYATFTDILEVEMEEARLTGYNLSIGKMKTEKIKQYEKIEFDALAVVENENTLKMIFPMLNKKESSELVNNMSKKIGGDETAQTKFSEMGKRKITAEQFDKEIE